MLGGYHTAGALIIKQSREQGLGAQMMGFDSLETAEFAQLGGAATDGVLMSFPPKAEDDPKNAALVKKFRDAKYDPEGYTLFTYAAVKVWADAANKAKSTDAAAVAAALRSGNYDSAVGALDLRPEGRHQEPGLRHLRLEGRQVVCRSRSRAHASRRRARFAGPFFGRGAMVDRCATVATAVDTGHGYHDVSLPRVALVRQSNARLGCSRMPVGELS